MKQMTKLENLKANDSERPKQDEKEDKKDSQHEKPKI